MSSCSHEGDNLLGIGAGASRRPRIGFLGEYPWCEDEALRGGVMQSNYRLVRALSRLEEIDLFVLAGSAHVSSRQFRTEGRARIVFYPHPKRDARLLYRPTRSLVKGFVAEFCLDLVHAQAHPHLIVGAIGAPVPHLVTVHGVWRNELAVETPRMAWRQRLQYPIYCLIENYYFRRLSNLVAITGEIEELVRRRAPKVRIFRVDNPIDERFFELEDNQDEPVVLFVGWVIHRKGLHVLMRAMRQLFLRVPGVTLRVVGVRDKDSQYVDELERENRDLVAANRLIFLGPISQERLYEEFSRCTVLCLPSLAESAPMVISQAMAAGKPVVATAVGGVPDMVAEGITGRLCRPNDAAHLAETLAATLGDREGRARMAGEARREAFRRHHPHSVALRTLAVYREVVGGQAAQAT
jgi:glycosyltransferase involved in cell wall biosynthesis